MPFPVTFAQQWGVAEVAPDFSARLKVDKRLGHHRVEQEDKANGTNQQASRET
jgi:hypothetical protein